MTEIETLAAWLFERFGETWSEWHELSANDKSYWAHDAEQVICAVERLQKTGNAFTVEE